MPSNPPVSVESGTRHQPLSSAGLRHARCAARGLPVLRERLTPRRSGFSQEPNRLDSPRSGGITAYDATDGTASSLAMRWRPHHGSGEASGSPRLPLGPALAPRPEGRARDRGLAELPEVPACAARADELAQRLDGARIARTVHLCKASPALGAGRLSLPRPPRNAEQWQRRADEAGTPLAGGTPKAHHLAQQEPTRLVAPTFGKPTRIPLSGDASRPARRPAEGQSPYPRTPFLPPTVAVRACWLVGLCARPFGARRRASSLSALKLALAHGLTAAGARAAPA